MLCVRSEIRNSFPARFLWFGIFCASFGSGFAGRVQAADWPMWRHDAARTGATDAALPKELHLQWTMHLPQPMPAWPASQPKLNFDRHYEPVVAGQRLLVSSTVSESVAAFNTRTGKREWVFLADGPVRFAPAIAGERVYVTSDDGYLHCLELATGKKLWSVLGGPSRKQVIGNDRLISMWPCRGGVVVKDKVAYFAAGIWPSMGIFIRAVDAESGKELWTNSTTGSRWVRHPHGADAFGSISPQGYLAISGDNLIVPGGRTLPGVFDLTTGELRHFEFGGKGEGGHDAFSSGDLMHVRGEAFRISDGQSVGNVPASFVGRGVVGLVSSTLYVTDPKGSIKEEIVKDRKGKEVKKVTYKPGRKESFKLDGPSERVFLEAGQQFFAAEPGRIAAYRYSELPGTLEPQWTRSTDPPASSESDSEAVSMIAADDRLFVVMSDSRLLCFGPEKVEGSSEVSWAADSEEEPLFPGEHLPLPFDLKVEKFQAGYAVTLAPPSDETLRKLLHETQLQLMCYQRPPGDRFSPWLWTHDWYGRRFTFRSGKFHLAQQPPYFASLIYNDVKQRYSLGEVLRALSTLRPYGGECWLVMEKLDHTALAAALAETNSIFASIVGEIGQHVTIEREGEWTVIRRPGPLPNAGVWTHQYGDSANSVVSADARVKAPLGLLWFGGPSNDRVLPRHGHGPSPQVAGGRLFIEGADMLRCVDVYTGRVWWERDLPGLGTYYDNTSHHPGAGEIGSNYVSLEDRVYVIHKDKLLALDAKTGETKHEFATATNPGARVEKERWGIVLAEGDLLITAASPFTFSPDEKVEKDDIRKVKAGSVPPSTLALIKPQAEWKYLAGSDPTGNWTSLTFDDSKWKTGQAGFGYGDDDDSTVLKMKGKYSRVYLRREFTMPEEIGREEISRLGGQLQFRLKYDDAFIVYLNGKEFARVGVESGSGAKAKTITSHEAHDFGMWIPEDGPSLIRPGKNVIAVEGHNSSKDSSDFTLDPFLIVSDYGDLKKVFEAAEKKQAAQIVAAKKTIKEIPLLRDVLLPAEYSAASQFLSVFDRHTGEFHWAREAGLSFRHNAICAVGDRLYCIDAFSPAKLAALKRRGIEPEGKAKLLCLNAKTGEEIWSTDEDVFGTFLSYSREHDILIQAGSAYRDRAKDEVDTGLVTYDGKTGQVIWKDLKLKYGGPLLIHHDRLITNGGGGFEIDLKTGKTTGWKYTRMYGCNTAVGSEHLLTFRSGAAGFCDLTGDSGTGNLGGFRSSCTANLIAADGVLNAPDYTRTCTCAYQLQTSLALVHMPEAESWTFGNEDHFDEPQKVTAINLGAPGDRRDKEGNLWFDFPSVGGPGPKINIETEPAKPERFIQHTSLVRKDDDDWLGAPNWVGASGVIGVRKVRVPLKLADTKTFTRVSVTLVFGLPPGETRDTDPRIFAISINGETVQSEFNLNKATLGPTGFKAPIGWGTRAAQVSTSVSLPKGENEIEITLTPQDGGRETVLSGIEISVKN
jgi:outer membrane protein assembly factor BamB